ncbi:MAG TPA: FAD-dependent oxidoreductase [Rhizomicrobium sp.]|jgi:3-(3-hydroxy-phenyl)propionate hydroxylase
MKRERVPAVIVGAGMVGLTLAIDLARQRVPVVVLEKAHEIAQGSRSICQAKRSLEIWDRLGAGEAIRDRGCTWKRGRIFHGVRELFYFDLLPQPDHKMPAFVNLQQPILEEILRRRLRDVGGEIRLGHELVSIQQRGDIASAAVHATDGEYGIDADWLISCEGVHSTVRRALNLPFAGEIFEDKFLICDVKMKAPFPAERWFWFEPTFHPGQTALLHRQADDVWRIDMQLGADVDAEAERDPARARPRLEAMLGHSDFEFEWISIYTFQCRTLQSYVHGQVIFAGDSAHQVSPFGARGGNGGVQDADNLGWKLARVVAGRASADLLQSYDSERLAAARENILQSTRTTNFMSPRTVASRILRDQTLALAAQAPFARALVNGGRLSTPAVMTASPLNTPDDDAWDTSIAPGSAAADAPLRTSRGDGYLSEMLGDRFVVLANSDAPLPPNMVVHGETVDVLQFGRDLHDSLGLVESRYDLKAGSAVLFRPDQHIVMRARRFDPAKIADSVAKALALRQYRSS